jgi:hypothetical protein
MTSWTNTWQQWRTFQQYRKDFNLCRASRRDLPCSGACICLCSMFKAFSCLPLVSQIRSTWLVAFPAYAMVPSTLEVICNLPFTYLQFERNTRKSIFWSLRFLDLSALASLVACFVFGFVRKNPHRDLIAAVLGLSVLEYCVSSFWAYHFWRTPYLRVYAPVCEDICREEGGLEDMTAGSGTLFQLYGRIMIDSLPNHMQASGTEGAIRSKEEEVSQLQLSGVSAFHLCRNNLFAVKRQSKRKT